LGEGNFEKLLKSVYTIFMTLKAIDEKLIKVLSSDARQSAEKLAKRLKVSPTTVRRRLKAITKNGTVRTVAMVDPAKAGLNLQAVIGFNIAHNSTDSIVQALENQPEVKWMATTTGRYDIVVKAAFASTAELAEFLQRKLAEIPGIQDTETFICLEVNSGGFIELT
jgi:Lrp/AsnC family transcriptional regulator for asnA, asnC and gidA